MSRMILTSRTRKLLIVLALALILTLGSGCGARTTPETTTSPLPSPEPQQHQQSSLPTPTPAVSTLPTPDPDAAMVTGRLVRAENSEPVVGVMAFLEQTTDDHRVPRVLYAPPNDQPRAKTNEQGQFIISEVPADEYVVILYSPPYALQVITEPNGDQAMLINPKPGKVTDIGTVRVTKFELP
jgi:hypothetical protein